jgi:hypothetical protein
LPTKIGPKEPNPRSNLAGIEPTGQITLQAELDRRKRGPALTNCESGNDSRDSLRRATDSGAESLAVCEGWRTPRDAGTGTSDRAAAATLVRAVRFEMRDFGFAVRHWANGEGEGEGAGGACVIVRLQAWVRRERTGMGVGGVFHTFIESFIKLTSL